MKIKGKRILLTGGSSGIGRAIATALAAEGARLVLTSRRPDALAEAVGALKASGAEVHGIPGDVTDPADRTTMLDGAVAALGGLDILINNAGGVRAGRLEETSEADIRAMIEVDLIAPILVTRAALPALRASGEGLIVDITSAIALIGMPFYATYAAAKAGLARFDEALRRELAGEGVRVLTVYPGATDTPMMRSSRAGPEVGFSREPAEAVAEAVVAGIAADAFEVVRGGEARAQMIALNRTDPLALDARFATLKDALGEAVRDHAAL
ncbi:SDR family NAD(P)-dependent oxidoreductase [Xanthobacter aminoxidans]|uniref:SDR family oxidoreductase n=1 Tax=Xanthobacter aminoxidans TaxID=186280 RepID=A0ABW6ZE73_9HYPH